MKTAEDIAVRREHFKELIAAWKNDGYLVLTEPDPGQRIMIIDRLQAAIDTLDWVCADD